MLDLTLRKRRVPITTPEGDFTVVVKMLTAEERGELDILLAEISEALGLDKPEGERHAEAELDDSQTRRAREMLAGMILSVDGLRLDDGSGPREITEWADLAATVEKHAPQDFGRLFWNVWGAATGVQRVPGPLGLSSLSTLVSSFGDPNSPPSTADGANTRTARAAKPRGSAKSGAAAAGTASG